MTVDPPFQLAELKEHDGRLRLSHALCCLVVTQPDSLWEKMS